MGIDGMLGWYSTDELECEAERGYTVDFNGFRFFINGVIHLL